MQITRTPTTFMIEYRVGVLGMMYENGLLRRLRMSSRVYIDGARVNLVIDFFLDTESNLSSDRFANLHNASESSETGRRRLTNGSKETRLKWRGGGTRNKIDGSPSRRKWKRCNAIWSLISPISLARLLHWLSRLVHQSILATWQNRRRFNKHFRCLKG